MLSRALTKNYGQRGRMTRDNQGKSCCQHRYHDDNNDADDSEWYIELSIRYNSLLLLSLFVVRCIWFVGFISWIDQNINDRIIKEMVKEYLFRLILKKLRSEHRTLINCNLRWKIIKRLLMDLMSESFTTGNPQRKRFSFKLFHYCTILFSCIR